jgi:hypothetical protein
LRQEPIKQELSRLRESKVGQLISKDTLVNNIYEDAELSSSESLNFSDIVFFLDSVSRP